MSDTSISILWGGLYEPRQAHITTHAKYRENIQESADAIDWWFGDWRILYRIRVSRRIEIDICIYIYIERERERERERESPSNFPLVRLIQLCVEAGGGEPMLREPILEILWWRPSNRWFVALKLPDLSSLTVMTVVVICQLVAYQEISGLSLTTRPYWLWLC